MLPSLKGAGPMRFRVRMFCTALLAVTLAACGGGGGSSSDDLISRQPVSPNSLTVTINPATVSDQTPSTVTVKLVDPGGAPVAGQDIALSCDETARLSDINVTTDATGQATARLFAVASGGGTLTATFRDSEGVGSASRHFDTVITSPGGGDDPDSGSVSLALNLTDLSGQVVGTTNTPITKNRPGRAQATVLSATGAPLANQVVTFAVTLGLLDPVSGTALTDAQGIAEIIVQAGQTEGAGILSASYEGPAGAVIQSIGFRTLGDSDDASGGDGDTEILIGAGSGAGFQEGVLALSALQIGVGSSLSVTANLVLATDNSFLSSPVQVDFSSVCASGGKASFDPASATSVGGTAVVSYKPDNGCKNDVITASATLNGELKTATSAPIVIIQSPPSSVEFLSADPRVLGLKGSAQVGAPESSVLRFQVKNSNGEPVGAGEVVNFSVVSDNGGFMITSAASASTSSEGIAAVTVQSGTVPFVASVRAELDANPAISATGAVSIQSGAITQDRFSMAVSALNPRAGNVQGASVDVSVRAADRFGNWAPDGTLVSFTTELGDIDGSCALEDGTCSVTWHSQAASPIHYDAIRAGRSCSPGTSVERARQGLPEGVDCSLNDRFGRNVITAWTVGEESFSDMNGNNIFDVDEPWVALPEAFRDDNENGLREEGLGYSEEFMDYNVNGQHDGVQPNFRGLGCSNAAEIAGGCTQLANVRASSQIVLSTDQVQIYVYPGGTALGGAVWESVAGGTPSDWGDAMLTGVATISSVTAGAGSIKVLVADMNGNAPAEGTTIEFDPGTLKGFGSESCIVGNQLEALVCEFSYGLPDEDPLPTAYDPIVFTVTSGGGLETTAVIPVNP